MGRPARHTAHEVAPANGEAAWVIGEYTSHVSNTWYTDTEPQTKAVPLWDLGRILRPARLTATHITTQVRHRLLCRHRPRQCLVSRRAVSMSAPGRVCMWAGGLCAVVCYAVGGATTRLVDDSIGHCCAGWGGYNPDIRTVRGSRTAETLAWERRVCTHSYVNDITCGTGVVI